LSGALSVIFGVLLIVLPAPAGLLSLVWLVGIYALATGVLLLILAFRVRSLAGDDDSGARRVPVDRASDDRRFTEGSDLVKAGDWAPNGRSGDANGAQDDVRGREVRDLEGREIGTVEDSYVDRDGAASRFLVVDAGDTPGLGGRHFLVPTEAVTGMDRDQVTLNQDRDKVADSSGFEEAVEPDRSYQVVIYRYYGYS
jgi:hypothetical protein